MKRGRKSYSQETAREVREEYLTSKKSIAAVSRMFKISESTASKMIEQTGPYKKEEKKTVCLDFDGVIHSYTSGWLGVSCIPDPPVKGTREAIECLRTDYIVKVYSTRCRVSSGLRAIKEYLAEHFIVVDEVCRYKPPAIIYVDDRGIQFNGNWNETIRAIYGFKLWTDKPEGDDLLKAKVECMGIHPSISDNARARELVKLVEDEKAIRLRYQDIVYKLCIVVDKHRGKKGEMVTVDQLVDEVESLLKNKK